MFNSVKEVHIAVENGLQHITSNRKQSIKPEFIDMALNMSVLKFIETTVVPEKNVIGRGLDHNQVTYDELVPLIKSTSLPVYLDELGEYYSILPFDYKNHVASEAYIQYSRDLEEAETENDIKYVYSVEFPDDNSEDSNKYRSFELYIGDIIIGNIHSVHSKEAKFIIVNHVINRVKNQHKDIEVYWQRYGNVYKANNFIIVSNISKVPVRVSYTGISRDGILNIITLDKVVNNSNKRSTASITKNVDKYFVKDNYYHTSNAHNHLNLTIEGDKIIIPSDINYRPISLKLDYITTPKLFDYKTNVMPELTVTEKIIDLTIQRLKAIIKDEGYSHIVNENKTI